MKFVDTIALLPTRRRTADGYLVAMARAARTGIQIYGGQEVGRPDLLHVRVYRAPEEVFASDSLASYAHKPLTNDHPRVAVSAANWKEHSVGYVGDEITREGEFVRVPLMLTDAAAIAALEAGKAELSAGYSAHIVWGDGTAPDGSKYEASQTKIRINHVALVSAGRAGANVRIDDGPIPFIDERDAAYAERNAELSNAWKGPAHG